jgi:translation elongation factor EF-G
MTQGRGSFEVSFERYEPLPSNLEEKIVAEYKLTKTEE